MKTPDEIKKALECCFYDSEQCGECPYYPVSCDRELVMDAREYIRQLEERAHQLDLLNLGLLVEKAQLETERDAAVADMRQASIYLCCACKKYHHAVRGVSNHYCEVIGERADFTGAISCGMFEWRGARKEETK